MKKITYDDFSWKLLPAFAFPFCLTTALIQRNYSGVCIILATSLFYVMLGMHRKWND